MSSSTAIKKNALNYVMTTIIKITTILIYIAIKIIEVLM